MRFRADVRGLRVARTVAFFGARVHSGPHVKFISALCAQGEIDGCATHVRSHLGRRHVPAGEPDGLLIG